MKKLFFIAVLPLTFTLFSCENTTTTNTTHDADSVLTTGDKDTAVVFHERVEREKEEYRVETQREIDSTQNYMNRMDKKMENAGAKAKQEWLKTKGEIQLRLDRAKKDLNEFGNKADNEWDQFRANVKANLDSLRADWRDDDNR